jgi:hypothetical protein
MSKAQQIYEETFTGNHVRSDEFKAGCLHILLLKLDGVQMGHPNFATPSTQLDAWMWGCEYGHELVAQVINAREAQA